MEKKKSSFSLILKHRGKSYTLKDLENTPIKKTKIELRIIEARKSGVSISEMDEKELRIFTDKIIVCGSAMYGCDMPQTEFFASVLSEEMVRYILDFGYDTLTLAEILLSLRLNTDGDFQNPVGENLPQVDFRGNFIHVSFVAKILKQYMVLRNNLERKFQNHIDGY